MMKKVLFIFFLLFLINFFNRFNIKTEPVFSEVKTGKQVYYLDFNDTNLNTSNIKEKFKNYDIQILALYPYIQDVYHKILNKDIDYFYLEDINDLGTFITYYKSLLKKLGLNNSIGYSNFNIRIRKLIVYSNFDELERFLSNNKFVKFL